MGCPDPCRLVELGPGRGTLMADALRAARIRPAFGAALRLHLVETSPYLRERQDQALAAHMPAAHRPTLARELRRGARGPPAAGRQRVLRRFAGPSVRAASPGLARAGGGQRRREAGLRLAAPGPSFALLTDRQRIGPKAEISPVALALAGEIGRHLAAAGGAALIIDYGTSQSLPARACRRCAGISRSILADTGEADLTAHVDFAALARAAEQTGAKAYGPMPQGEFLLRLGLDARGREPDRPRDARAGPTTSNQRDGACSNSREMGTLFKALALAAPGLPPPPGFADPS